MSRPTSSQGLSALRAAVAPTGAARGAAPAGTGPAPEGDTAVSLGLVQRAQQGDAEAFGELYDL